jgi:hypothetical protein
LVQILSEMKIKLVTIILISIIIPFKSYSQSIELGSLYSSGNATFFKNVPGLSFGMNYELKNQFLFTQFNTSFKNVDYSQFEAFMGDLEIKEVKGDMFVNSVKLGLSHKLISTNNAELSLGGYGSLNYFRFNEKARYLEIDPDFPVRDTLVFYKGNKNNKPGIGCEIDFRIKNVIFENIDLFSRFCGDVVYYGNSQLRGVPFNIGKIKALSFTIGLRLNLSTGHNKGPKT